MRRIIHVAKWLSGSILGIASLLSPTYASVRLTLPDNTGLPTPLRPQETSLSP